MWLCGGVGLRAPSCVPAPVRAKDRKAMFSRKNYVMWKKPRRGRGWGNGALLKGEEANSSRSSRRFVSPRLFEAGERTAPVYRSRRLFKSITDGGVRLRCPCLCLIERLTRLVFLRQYDWIRRPFLAPSFSLGAFQPYGSSFSRECVVRLNPCPCHLFGFSQTFASPPEGR